MSNLNSDFNLHYRKKMIYKRKRKRKLFLIFTIFISILLILSNFFISLFKNNYKFVATIHLPEIEEEKLFTICIDPGHGDTDPGAIGNDVQEKDVTLAVSLKLGELLSSHDDINVIYTRTSDSLPWQESSNDSLKERISISNISNSDIIVSIHCNSVPNDTTVKGIETWYKPDDNNSMILSEKLLNSLAELDFTNNRGLKTYDDVNDELAMVELPEATSSLVELGFLSNIADASFLSSSLGENLCAKALYDGIIEYKNFWETK